MGAEASMPLHFHTHNLIPSTMTFRIVAELRYRRAFHAAPGSSAPRDLQLHHILLNRMKFVESGLRSDFPMRNEPLHAD
jgi:hypothetical protein